MSRFPECTAGGLGLALALLACASQPRAAAEGAAEPRAVDSPAPVRLDRDSLAGLGLEEYEPYPAEMVLEGRSEQRSRVLFSGDEIVVEVYEAEAAKLAITDPFPCDEFIYVLSGKLVLTDANDVTTEYTQGEFLVVPRGFTGGTWEMLGEFRELVVIEKHAYQRWKARWRRSPAARPTSARRRRRASRAPGRRS
jgi:uncharacterized cupin superfamily protein